MLEHEGSIGRREFLRRALATGGALAAASGPVSLLGGCFMKSGEGAAPATAGGAAPPDGLGTVAQRFGVGTDEIRRAMSVALSKGGDYCDLYFQHTVSNALTLEDDAVNRARTSVERGVGVRVLKGDATGYAFTEE